MKMGRPAGRAESFVNNQNSCKKRNNERLKGREFNANNAVVNPANCEGSVLFSLSLSLFFSEHGLPTATDHPGDSEERWACIPLYEIFMARGGRIKDLPFNFS